MKGIKRKLKKWPLLPVPVRLLRRMIQRLYKPQPERLYDIVLKQNISRHLSKRALLSYIVHSFAISIDDPRFFSHINIWRSHEIVRILNNLGYIVDVIDYRDTNFVPRREYDLFIGHGGINFEKIAQRLSTHSTKIYFSTGCYWKFHNDQEMVRFAQLYERKRVNLTLDRFIKDSEEGALLASDGIIGIGNDFTRKSYFGFSPVITLNNTSLYDSHYEKCEKDFKKGRKHFLYFAGSGPVHKGLDLLLEAFSRIKEHLWICSRIDQRFEEIYSDELHNTPNIHLDGWTQPRSTEIYELMDICNYIILPSCSEGQAHSVVECMNQGLIPVVSRACGLDVGDYGVILNQCTIEEIAKVVPMLSSYSAAKCNEMAARARQAAVTDFSESAFHQNMRDAIQYIIGGSE